MIVDVIKSIVQNLNMSFKYGDKPSLNLQDGEITGYNVWLLPVEHKSTVTQYNRVSSRIWDVAFFIFIKSDLDSGGDYYNEKWEQNIKPIYTNNYVDNIVNQLSCEERYTTSDIVVKEVINLFDWNMDGLYITMTISEDLI